MMASYFCFNVQLVFVFFFAGMDMVKGMMSIAHKSAMLTLDDLVKKSSTYGKSDIVCTYIIRSVRTSRVILKSGTLSVPVLFRNGTLSVPRLYSLSAPFLCFSLPNVISKNASNTVPYGSTVDDNIMLVIGNDIRLVIDDNARLAIGNEVKLVY